jgi:hypothetical protein
VRRRRKGTGEVDEIKGPRYSKKNCEQNWTRNGITTATIDTCSTYIRELIITIHLAKA